MNHFYATIKVDNLEKGGIAYLSTASGGYLGAFNKESASGGIASSNIDVTNNTIKILKADGRVAIKYVTVISLSPVVSITGSDT